MLSPTVAALLGSIATAVAIFGGGIAVERFKRRQDRDGMALALAGAIDAMLALIEARDMTAALQRAVPELRAGRPVYFPSLVGDNTPFRTITLAYAGTLGALGGDLPFRVARFLTWMEGLQQDLKALDRNAGEPARQLALMEQMARMWDRTDGLGRALVVDLRRLAHGNAHARAALAADACLALPPRRAGAHEAPRHEAPHHEAGRHEAGRHEAGRHEAGRLEAGRHEAGRPEAGRR